MIRLGLRLTVAGGREAITRLAIIAVAVAVGTGLLLTTVAGLRAVGAQNSRYAWLETGFPGSNAPAATPSTHAVAGKNPLWWLIQADYFHGELIGRVDLAPTGSYAAIPPGLPRLPRPGEFYASPALSRLLMHAPRAELGDRYPGTQVGTIGPSGLASPTSLIIVIGRTVADLSHVDGARQVTRISTTNPDKCAGECAPAVGTNSNGITLILSVVIAALLFPVLIFIGGATRLSAARREQRFAALRLVGATPGQIAVIATVESAVAAVAGAAAGFGLFFALRPVVAGIPFTGEAFFPSDLSLSLTDMLLVGLGIPVAAAVAARLALRRVNVSPLGVSRRVTPRPPRAWRIFPLLAGVAELGYFAYLHDIGAHSRTNTTLEAVLYLVGVLLIMAGLVIAGPWLTMLGSRLMAARANRPATLLAARRLADNPHAAFRAISGLVLAVFVGTCALGIITTIVANSGPAGAAAESAATLVQQLRNGPEPNQVRTPLAAATTDRLNTIAGVTGVVAIHSGPATGRWLTELVACAELARLPTLGHCPPGVQTVTIQPQFVVAVAERSSMPVTTWPASDVTAGQLQSLPVDLLVAGTDGSAAAVESARTVLEHSSPTRFPPQTVAEYQADNTRLLNDYRQLANVVMLTSLPIAGCALAVSIAGGLAERKRPFSLLRLTGVPLGLLRRVVGLEAAAPLLVTAAVSAAAGLLAAQLFLRAQLYERLVAPGVQYYLVIAAGLLTSLAIIASTLPLLKQLTGPEAARNE